MAFTYDITTDAGALRFRLGDTDSTAYAFEDTEITYLLTSGGTVKGAAVVGLRVLLSERARRVKRFALNGTSYDDTATIAALQSALKAAEVEAGSAALPVMTPVMLGLLPSNEGWESP